MKAFPRYFPACNSATARLKLSFKVWGFVYFIDTKKSVPARYVGHDWEIATSVEMVPDAVWCTMETQDAELCVHCALGNYSLT